MEERMEGEMKEKECGRREKGIEEKEGKEER